MEMVGHPEISKEGVVVSNLGDRETARFRWASKDKCGPLDYSRYTEMRLNIQPHLMHFHLG